MKQDELVKLIKKMIRLEVKRQVKNTLNEVLADKFLNTLNESNFGGYNLKNSLQEPAQAVSPPSRNQERLALKEREALEQKKKKLLEAANLPSFILEDIDTDDVKSLTEPPKDPEEVDIEDINRFIRAK